MSEIKLKCDKCKEFYDDVEVYIICNGCYNGTKEQELMGEFIDSLDLILNKKTYRFSTVGCNNKYDISYPSEELIKNEKKKWEAKKLE